MDPDSEIDKLIRAAAVIAASLDQFPGNVSLETRTARNVSFIKMGSFDF